MRKKLIFLFLISSFYSFSQEKHDLLFDNAQLQTALNKIENVFEVKFSFQTKIVKNQSNIYFSQLPKNYPYSGITPDQ